VNNLKAKLLEKLEQSIADIRLSPEEINNGSGDLSPSASAHKVTSSKAVCFCLMSSSLARLILVILSYLGYCIKVMYLKGVLQTILNAYLEGVLHTEDRLFHSMRKLICSS
jgi:hypothetical protein